MADLVLDENIYVKGLKAECTNNADDLLAAQIITLTQAYHRWIFTSDVIAAYHRQFKRNQCRGTGANRLVVSLSEVFASQDRFLMLHDPPEVEGSYHQKDQHVVCAAAAVSGSYLITTDIRLKEALERTVILQSYGFQVVVPEEAGALLSPLG